MVLGRSLVVARGWVIMKEHNQVAQSEDPQICECCNKPKAYKMFIIQTGEAVWVCQDCRYPNADAEVIARGRAMNGLTWDDDQHIAMMKRNNAIPERLPNIAHECAVGTKKDVLRLIAILEERSGRNRK